jgi:hypothetical protein
LFISSNLNRYLRYFQYFSAPFSPCILSWFPFIFLMSR